MIFDGLYNKTQVFFVCVFFDVYKVDPVKDLSFHDNNNIAVQSCCAIFKGRQVSVKFR